MNRPVERNSMNFLGAACLAVLLQFCVINSYAANNAVAATQLLKRLFPQSLNKFVFEQIQADSNRDVFEIESNAGKIIIRGNDANSMAVGLNHYLKYYCLVSVSWYKDDKISLPSNPPVIPQKIKQTVRCENRFFLNYCTFGYTMPWWKWEDWQRFIDWMALNGINMPLAITGQEAVWYNVWKKFGLSDKEIRSYFTGPAYLPWHRMANIDHWEGPLPLSWINGQLRLQQQILKRERELNMKPVLPAFAGHVPALLKSKFPSAKIASLGEWAGFKKDYASNFLDPFDPLFSKIQKEFLSEQTKLFGTDHFYGTDPFNEVTPPSWEPQYLASVSKTIYNTMQASDTAARWIQMSWMFYLQRKNWTNTNIEGFLNAVPKGKMILLDYYCDNTEIWKITDKFFGQPYIWCYLGNFGSNTMLGGNMNETEERMENAFKNGGKNLWGIGSTLEGFGVNPVMIEYVFEKAWSDGPAQTGKWVSDWAIRRRGKYDKNTLEAWNILNSKILIQHSTIGQGTLTNARPSLEGHGDWPANPKIDYNNADLLKVWGLLNNTPDGALPSVYRYDLVNIGRQVIGNYFQVVRDRFTAAYKNHDLKAMTINGREMIEVIHDMDALLMTNSSFLLGKWIEDARAMGVNEKEKQYFEHDARTILATWGEKGSAITDYANRNLSGLMNDYYGKRWEMFISDVISASEKNIPFNQKAFDDKSFTFEWSWTKKRDEFSVVPKGNSLLISRKLYDKYVNRITKN